MVEPGSTQRPKERNFPRHLRNCQTLCPQMALQVGSKFEVFEGRGERSFLAPQVSNWLRPTHVLQAGHLYASWAATTAILIPPQIRRARWRSPASRAGRIALSVKPCSRAIHLTLFVGAEPSAMRLLQRRPRRLWRASMTRQPNGPELSCRSNTERTDLGHPVSPRPHSTPALLITRLNAPGLGLPSPMPDLP